MGNSIMTATALQGVSKTVERMEAGSRRIGLMPLLRAAEAAVWRGGYPREKRKERRLDALDGQVSSWKSGKVE